MCPNGLHVIHNVVSDVNLKTSDLGQVIVVITQGLRISLGQGIESSDLPLQTEHEVTDRVCSFIRPILHCLPIAVVLVSIAPKHELFNFLDSTRYVTDSRFYRVYDRTN